MQSGGSNLFETGYNTSAEKLYSQFNPKDGSMARKKHKPDGEKPSSRNRAKPSVEFLNLADRRVMEEAMRQVAATLQGGKPKADTPLDKAQVLLDQAFKERDSERRVRLAQEALAVCPDCADAYVLLAEHSPRRKEALRLYQQGVEAGERALGAEKFERAKGRFWGILETRPYMRARYGLATALWTMGDRDEAIRHLQEMLRLNPGDNQGVRYTLASFLLFLDRDDELGKLLDQYPNEELATWSYTRALLSFRQKGDTLEGRQSLKKAKKANKHVPPYLLGRKNPSPNQSGHFRPGDDNEALDYVGGFMVGWKSTPGAIAWLRQNDKDGKPKDTPSSKGPLDFIKKWVKGRLSQTTDIWQADFRQTPNWMGIDGEMVRPWLVLVTSVTTDLVLAHQIIEEAPTPAMLWDTLVQSMQHPAAGDAHRPTELHVRSDDRWESLRPHLAEVGISLVATGDVAHLDVVFEGLSEHFGGKREPGLLEMPGIKPAQVAHFYDAAAYFFRETPWKKVGFEAAIKIECEKYAEGPRYGVLMGQAGLTAGLALYDDLNGIRRLMNTDAEYEDNARDRSTAAVTFGEEFEIPVADLEAGKKHSWKIAREDAYPSVFVKDPNRPMRPPLAWELELLEGCLRAVPVFVNRRKQDDMTPEELTVPTASGPLRLTLSWVVEE